MLTSAQPDDRPSRATNLLVVQTYVVQPFERGTHYEIHLAPDDEPGAHRTVLHTDDVNAYALALELEGKANARVSATWVYRRRGSYRYAVLRTLEVEAVDARERDDDDGRTYADPRDERDERARR
jgi:hypothetical protein